MTEADFDEQVALLMVGLMRVRRALDPESFDSLLGALQAEIQLGFDLAEEQALERAMRRQVGGNVVPFCALWNRSVDTGPEAS